MKMSKTWNEDQLKAITTRNKNILVSASAGSGKTGVLIQRLVDLVTKDRIELNEILAMTFTNAAAAEMKKDFLRKSRHWLKRLLMKRKKLI